jgi:hypothetical protein
MRCFTPTSTETSFGSRPAPCPQKHVAGLREPWGIVPASPSPPPNPLVGGRPPTPTAPSPSLPAPANASPAPARCGHGGAVAIACHRAALRGRSPICNCIPPGPSRVHRPSAPRPSRGSPPAPSVIRWPRFPSAHSVACPRRSLAPLALEPPARAALLRRPR